jgi:hypothetical protein
MLGATLLPRSTRELGERGDDVENSPSVALRRPRAASAIDMT